MSRVGANWETFTLFNPVYSVKLKNNVEKIQTTECVSCQNCDFSALKILFKITLAFVHVTCTYIYPLK